MNREQSEDLRGKTPQAHTGKTKARRAAALAAVILLAGLYLVTFVLAVLGDPRGGALLRFCFGMTIFLPIFLWVALWFAGWLFHKKTMASLEILDSNPRERRRMEEALARQMEGQKSEKSPGAEDERGGSLNET